jgi:hypothetical protein
VLEKLASNSILVLAIALFSVATFFAQTGPRSPMGGRDFKVKYRTTMGSAGGGSQTRESVTMIKGPRERSEQHFGSGYDMINITQCDLKRTIQIGDSAKKYLITPIETGDAPSAPGPANVSGAAGPNRKGGLVTYITTSVDTGERKEMFGFTARHVKSSTTIQSSPDACNPVNQRSELDGWYIDLNVGLDCQIGRPPVMPNRGTPPACRDQTRFRREGSGRLGFPLIETVKLYGEGGQIVFSTTKEVIELSRESLDMALFDIPAGYTEASSQQELFGMPSMADIMAGRTQGSNRSEVTNPASPAAEVKKPGSILIGVVQINNRAGKSVSVDALRGRLIGQLQGSGLEAIALNASSQMEAEAEAKAKQCDFILYTDIAALKSSKLGGVFGRVAGMEGSAKTEAKVEFKLFAVGESAPRLQSSASAKEEGDDASASTAIDNEARTVSAAALKKGRG